MNKIKIIEVDFNSESNLENDIFEYLLQNSMEFRRESTINSILDKNYSIEEKNYLIYNTQFSIHGTTFQGSGFRNILSLKDASHVVIKFIREDNQLYGMINFLDTPIGRGLKFASDIEYTLVPIYTSDKKLCFFDIDPNIKFIDGTESFHYTIK